MITVKSYGRTQEFETREQAQAFYRRCLMCSEGSEQSTYADILGQLASGCTDITDDPYPYGKVIRY